MTGNGVVTGDDIMKAVSELARRPIGEQERSIGWAEIGIDSFAATELLLRLEMMFGGDHAQFLETALFASATPEELISRLTGGEGVQ